MRPARTLVLAALLSSAAAAGPLGGQELRRFMPGREYLPLLAADPRQPTIAAKLLYAFDSPTQFGSILEGEPVLGASLPFYVLAGSGLDDALVLGFEGAVFARFNMETREKQLIASDWVFAVPLVLYRGSNWVRLRYYHTSGHLGDEYILAFDVDRTEYARDIAELMGWWQVLPSLALYGGGGWAFRVDPPDDGEFTVRLGAQAEAHFDRGLRPYGAVDAYFDQDNDWKPSLNIQIGVATRALSYGRNLRIAAELFTGPTRVGQFHDQETTFVTLGVYIDL